MSNDPSMDTYRVPETNSTSIKAGIASFTFAVNLDQKTFDPSSFSATATIDGVPVFQSALFINALLQLVTILCTL